MITKTSPSPKPAASAGTSSTAAPTRYEDKIARIRAGRYAAGDFILADAKDSDMSGGITTSGARRDAEGRVSGYRNREEFLAEMQALISQDVIDIMLTSASNMERLMAHDAFAGSKVEPAVRGNDSTDVWGVVRGGRYRQTASRPFRSADLAFTQAGLCLYSITFNNDTATDLATLEAFNAFRPLARAAGKRYFLEVFNPNAAAGMERRETGQYVNDCIVRTLAGLTDAERPEFLKVAYNGPQALEELVGYDASVVVGVLGGGSGTHRDTFELVAQSERHGARLALFGRKINMAEHQPTLLTWLRAVADVGVNPSEAVRGYHADLKKLGLRPDRPLADDMCITEEVLLAAART